MKKLFMILLIFLSISLVSCKKKEIPKIDVEISKINFGFIEKLDSFEFVNYRNYDSRPFSYLHLGKQYFMIIEITVITKQNNNSPIFTITTKIGEDNNFQCSTIETNCGIVIDEQSQSEDGYYSFISSLRVGIPSEIEEVFTYLLVFSFIPKAIGSFNTELSFVSEEINFINNISNWNPTRFITDSLPL